MERAGRILGNLRIKSVEVAGVRTYHLAPKAWTTAVGKTIAAHTRPAFLDGSTLIVEVEDQVWETQLRTLKGAILFRIEKVIGRGAVTDITYRVAPAKRPVAIAVRPTPMDTAFADESDAIDDPVMRRLYRSARRRATS